MSIFLEFLTCTIVALYVIISFIVCVYVAYVTYDGLERLKEILSKRNSFGIGTLIIIGIIFLPAVVFGFSVALIYKVVSKVVLKIYKRGLKSTDDN